MMASLTSGVRPFLDSGRLRVIQRTWASSRTCTSLLMGRLRGVGIAGYRRIVREEIRLGIHAQRAADQDRHGGGDGDGQHDPQDRKSTRLNSSHSQISYAVFCLKKK